MQRRYNLRQRKSIPHPKKRRKIILSSSEEESDLDISFLCEEDISYSSGDSETEVDIDISLEESSGEELSEEDGGEFSPEDYFQFKTAPLIKIIVHKIKESYPELEDVAEPHEIKFIVQEAMKNVHHSIYDEYCGAEPKDESWKAGLEWKEIDDLEPQLKKIRTMIEEDAPTLQQILKAHLPLKEKRQAIEYYDILQNLEPYTDEHLHMKRRIGSILQSQIHFKDQDLVQMEAEESRLKGSAGCSVGSLKAKILTLDASDLVKGRIYEMYQQMQSLDPANAEFGTIRQKIEWAVSLPYRKIIPAGIESSSSDIEIARYCDQVYHRLSQRFYGAEKIKERIIQIVNNRIRNPGTRASLALCGPPGVGKTALVAALAKSLNAPYDRIALGGMEDPSILTGSDNSWLGSSPSIMLQMLKKMGCSNGIVLFDEIDKLSDGSRGMQVENSLLQITDYTQNHQFKDLFLSEYPHDLSKIWFLFAMNKAERINSVLKDRLDIIHLEPYTSRDKQKIMQLHLLPRAVKDVGLNQGDITISDQACGQLMSLLSREMKEGGLRPVERHLHLMVSRINLLRGRTCRSSSSSSSKGLQLSYSLPDFKGFPYRITRKSVQNLWTDPKQDFSYLNMFG